MIKSKKNFNTKKNISQNYLLFGLHSVLAALKNPNRIKTKLFITEKYADEFSKFANIVLIKLLTKEEMSSLLRDKNAHQDIALEVSPLSYSLDKIINENTQKSLIIILDQVVDPHNVGAILRTAAAFGASAVINSANSSPGETGVIAKSASGGLEAVPYLSVTNITKTIELLKKNGYWIYGLDGSAKSLIPKEFADKACIVLGTEESGIRKLVKENCDLLCKIRMNGNMESLNVSNAAAIAIYSYSQQSI